MRQCPKCREGNLNDQVIESWETRGNNWILIRNVPALVCDECGLEVIPQATAEALEAFTSPTGDARHLETRLFPVYDFTNPHPNVDVSTTQTTSAVTPSMVLATAG